MMITDMKKNELNELEMDSVSGGMFPAPPQPELSEEAKRRIDEENEAFINAVSTAWEVVKHAFDVCG